jgi:hypothetical protein
MARSLPLGHMHAHLALDQLLPQVTDVIETVSTGQRGETHKMNAGMVLLHTRMHLAMTAPEYVPYEKDRFETVPKNNNKWASICPQDENRGGLACNKLYDGFWVWVVQVSARVTCATRRFDTVLYHS